MGEDVKATVAAAAELASAITGPGTPDSVSVTQRDDALKVWFRALSGPAVSLMLIGTVLLLADWVPWLGSLSVWTSITETIRAQGVVIVACVLSGCVGLVLWVAHVGKPSRTEFSAGPATIKIEQGDSE